MTISRRTVLLAMVGLPTSTLALAATASPASAAATTSSTGVPATAHIDVSVATLWVSPGLNRPVDLPSTTNPADPAAWMAAMSLADRLWLVGELETQASYGQAVRILQTSGDWVNVAVVGQPTPRNALGYPGWMPRAQLARGGDFARHARKPFAMVTSRKAKLYHDPHQTREFMELSFNTRLPVLSRTRHGVHVATPSAGAKWLRDQDVAVYRSAADIPRPTGPDLIATAGRFLGLHYLWAGVSAYGFDCSGFTSTVYGAHGITIPRDTGPQYAGGVKVAREDLATGDLIFFAHDNGTGSIHHVGIYAGDGDIIDTPTNTATVESGVERVKLVEHRYINEYVAAPHDGQPERPRLARLPRYPPPCCWWRSPASRSVRGRDCSTRPPATGPGAGASGSPVQVRPRSWATIRRDGCVFQGEAYLRRKMWQIGRSTTDSL